MNDVRTETVHLNAFLYVQTYNSFCILTHSEYIKFIYILLCCKQYCASEEMKTQGNGANIFPYYIDAARNKHVPESVMQIFQRNPFKIDFERAHHSFH